MGYCLTAGVYFYVGFFGGMSCGHRVNDININPKKYEIIFDCFLNPQTA